MNFITENNYFDFEEEKQEKLCDCGAEFGLADNKGYKSIYCLECGVMFEYNENYVDKPFLQKPKNMGEKAKKIMAEVVAQFIKNSKLKCSNTQMERILYLCYGVYVNDTKRANPRKGLFAASTMRVLGISKTEAAKIFKIELNYVSSGINCLNKAINNYPFYDLREITETYGFEIWKKAFSVEFPEEITELILLSNAFQIGSEIPLKTRILGTILLFLRSKKGFTETELFTKTEIKKEKFLKFYREFSAKFYIKSRKDGKFSENLLHRFKTLRVYFDKKKLQYPKLNSQIKTTTIYAGIYNFDPSIGKKKPLVSGIIPEEVYDSLKNQLENPNS